MFILGIVLRIGKHRGIVKSKKKKNLQHLIRLNSQSIRKQNLEESRETVASSWFESATGGFKGRYISREAWQVNGFPRTEVTKFWATWRRNIVLVHYADRTASSDMLIRTKAIASHVRLIVALSVLKKKFLHPRKCISSIPLLCNEQFFT